MDTCSIVPVGPWSREGQRPLGGRSLGIGPGVRTSRTHQKRPNAQLKENCGGFFTFYFAKLGLIQQMDGRVWASYMIHG